MAWYRSGTLSVTNGSTSVTGAGTSWIAGAGIGEALYAPDGRIYEIANISSNTSLTLATAYLGTTQSAQSYTIIPSQSYIRDLAADAAALISQYAGIASGAGAGKFTDGTVSTPGIAFASDVDTGIYHPATNTLGIAAGGINQMQVGTAGVNIGTLSANPVISAGTANGVTYLNASKQLTSGSALTFDGTNFKNAGAVVSGASGSAGTFTLNRSSDGNGIAVFESLAGTNDVGLRNAQGSILFSATGTEQMRLTSTGLGVGTSSPGYKLDVAGTLNVVNGSNGRINIGAPSNYLYGDSTGNLIIGTSGSDKLQLDASGNLILAAGDFQFNRTAAFLYANGGSGGSVNSGFYLDGSGNTLRMYTGNAERIRIDSSGNLLVGTTFRGHIGGVTSFDLDTVDGNIYINHANGTPAGYYYCSFGYGVNPIGSVSQNGTTAVSYNTSSDYRLKNITGPITSSGVYIDSLNPVEGTWKADGSTFVGLIAHEVQEVSRTQVATGEKDGAEMQAMDYSNSELIANLIAEVKSLRARVAALETN